MIRAMPVAKSYLAKSRLLLNSTEPLGSERLNKLFAIHFVRSQGVIEGILVHHLSCSSILKPVRDCWKLLEPPNTILMDCCMQ
jgi:hypothetical protein